MLFNSKFVAEPIEHEVKISYDWTTEINSYKYNVNVENQNKASYYFVLTLIV